MEALNSMRLTMVALLGSHFLMAGIGTAWAQTESEDAVKAAYLVHFASYVNWPEDPEGVKFIIEVVGAPGVARELEHLLPGHRIHGHAAEEHEVFVLRELGHPQILYIGRGHSDQLRRVLLALEGTPTLLVTDDDDGLDSGGVLNFVMLDHHVRFEVSLTAAEHEHLRISADLLALAVRVRGGRRQSRSSSTVGDARPVRFPQAPQLMIIRESGGHPKRGTEP